jgi:hypothetical protein
MDLLKRKWTELQRLNRPLLFFRAYIQVGLVAINTYQLAHGYYLGAFIVGFLISLVWSYNVKSMAFGSFADKVSYALGAACGTVTGLYIATNFLNL